MVRPSQRRRWPPGGERQRPKHPTSADVCGELDLLPKAKLFCQNEQIADWLVRLTAQPAQLKPGLCYLFLRNVKGFVWNHKRVYRIYRLLELNSVIKPAAHGAQKCRSHSAVPDSGINQGFIDDRHDNLDDGCVSAVQCPG